MRITAEIHVLSKDVYQLIAAGEVVERPASAVKEMVENSVDAGAKSVTVEIKNGGTTYQRVTDNGCGMTKEELENKVATLTGGRAAEEIVFGSVTTGASNDIEQATKVARAMITRYGMDEHFDMVAMETVTNQYLGGDTSLACSAETQTQIDRQVVQLVKTQHEKARQILTENREKLDELAQYLYEKETITGEEFMKILNS